jgi:uncharacterized membrane protein
MKTSVFGLKENVAGALCYAGLFFTGIIFLVLERENRCVRFHALQSTLWFLLMALAGTIARYIPFIHGPLSWMVGAITFATWLILMLFAFAGRRFKLPMLGDVVDAKVG